MAGSREYGWLNAQRADGRRARDTMMMMMEASPPFPSGYGPVSNSFKVCPTHFYRGAENFYG